MPSPHSCTRCSKPLAIVSPGGLCPECAATADTADPTSPAFRRAGPASADLTATAAHAPAQATATANPAGATAAGGKEAAEALPNAPAGYDLLDRLGSGGMGSVYLARDQAAERLVAMKFLHQPAGLDALERFLVELRVLARLDHPNVVRVLASDFLRADPYFTMEYMPGGSLSRALDAGAPVPAAEAVRLIRTVAQAVAAAHVQGVIHRDLKPSNILLAADGTPKVSDFGLAKRLDADEGLTVTGAALGTPSYMPPEQISRKNGEVGPWSDVYGLGATLYQLLTGRAPFLGESSDTVIAQVLVDPPRRLRALRPDVPAALEGIVLKCLEKDSKDRYQTVAELVADLDRFTAGQRPVAPPLTPWRRAKRWVKRNRRAAALCAAVAVLLAGAFTLGALWPKPKSGDPPDPRQEMQDDLAARRSVALLMPGGMPRWHQWRCAAATLAEENPPDGSCSFQSVGLTMLDLFPAPATDRYRLSLELQHWGGVNPGQGEQTGRPSVGLYFAADSQPAGTGRVTSAFAVTFNDTPPAPPGADGKPKPAAVQFKPGVIVESKDGAPEFQWAAGGTRRFQPAALWPQRGPGAWRQVVVEVTPDRLAVLWRDADSGKLVPVMHWGARPVESWTGDQTRDRYAALQDLFDKSKRLAGAGAVVRPWSPRMPFGVLTLGARLKFRNVVLEPLP